MREREEGRGSMGGERKEEKGGRRKEGEEGAVHRMGLEGRGWDEVEYLHTLNRHSQ